MKRRGFVLAASVSPAFVAGCGGKPTGPLAGLPSALQLLQSLPATARMAEGWSLAQVLVHLAQSVEYSMTGFPALNSSLFRSTVGPLAFSVFQARGHMSHGLTDPIPGAPALDVSVTVPEAADRLVKALSTFDAHGGVLMPHFAYGPLDKAEYLQAHLMHLANHWQHYRPA